MGMAFALLAIRGIQQYNIPISAFLLLYGVFLFDTTLTLGRRLFSGQRWWEAHRTHFYQQAVRYGLGHSQVTILATTISICLAIFASFEVFEISQTFVWFPGGLVVLLAALLGIQSMKKLNHYRR